MDIINLFDYATLKWIWWLFIGALLIGFAIMDGHDMGIGTLLPFVAKTDEERGEHRVEEKAGGTQLFFLELDGEQLEPRLERGQTGIGEPPQGLAEARGRGVAHAALSGG